jgi:stearoyl-CoA desaturase (delta-9 desaturase)
MISLKAGSICPVGSTRFWRTVTGGYLTLLHVAPVAALVRGTHPRDWIALAVIYVVVSLGCTVGLHRYFAHRSFQTTRTFQLAMGLMAAIAFGDPIAFSARHRIHHAKSDTDGDVHSPRQGILYCWLGTLFDYGLSEAEMLRLVPDLAEHAEIRWLHRLFFVPGTIVMCATWILGGFGVFAIGYCGACLAVVHAGSAVNYFGHKRWTRRYDTPDNSANNPLLALISLGEGWHNNHHYYPGACRAGFRWWEVDVLYYEIKLLSWLGIVWDLKEVPDRVRRDMTATLARTSRAVLPRPGA